MPLVACYNCGGAMSDQAAVCQRCAAPSRLRQPAPAAPRPASGTLRFAQVAALAGCVGLAILAPPDPTDPIATGAKWAGYITGAYVVGPLFVSTLLLVWLRWTRRLIPFLALGISALTYLAAFGAQARAERSGEVSALRPAASAPADTGTGAAVPADVFGPPPASTQGKMMWVTRRYMAERQEHMRRVAALYGVGRAGPPPAWSTTRYMAEAGTYAGIGQYWENAGAYAAEMERALPAWSDSTLRALGREARLPAAQVETMVRERTGETDEPGPGRWELEGAVAAAALAYHRYLVSIDPRVSYDAGSDQALFQSEGEAAEAQRLSGRVDAASRALDAYMERHHQPTKTLPGESGD
ncbi:MAG TPA: hypothetical protein VF092_01220 [Longimicrobium sp.]